MDRISRNFTIGKKKMEYLSSEHVHKKINMNVMFLFLIEVHISSICDSDVLYEVYLMRATSQATERRVKIEFP